MRNRVMVTVTALDKPGVPSSTFTLALDDDERVAVELGVAVTRMTRRLLAGVVHDPVEDGDEAEPS